MKLNSILYHLIIVITLTFTFDGNSQQSAKLLFKKKNLETLRELTKVQPNDSLKIVLITSYIKEAKKQNDTISILDGYYLLTDIKSEYQEEYVDSILLLSQTKNYKNYPSIGYLLKGNSKYNKGNYKNALDFYIKAFEASKHSDNHFVYLSSKFNIGILKNAAGEREEAKDNFLDYINYLEKNKEYKNSETYNKVLFAIADAYVHSENKKLDSAKIYIDKGIKETLKSKDTIVYSLLLVTSGIQEYFSANYNIAIDSLKKGKRLIKKRGRIQARVAICDYYLGRSYYDQGNKEQGIRHFEKVDSIIKNTKNVIPELLDTYNYLINHAKAEKNIQLHSNYINTLLRLDSIKDSNQLYLTKNISKKYDIAELLAEKEKLLDQSNQDSFLQKNIILLLIISLVVLITIIITILRKNRINKNRFLKILDEQKQRQQPQDITTKNTSKIRKKEEIQIPKDVIENILAALEEFETSESFTKQHHTLNSLSKELNTNSTYLSKVINEYKNVNFSGYLNNLRIDFAIQELTKNKALRTYKIQAIAEEVGFKNAQSFSTAFHKKTGIYPSYFIKQIRVKTTQSA